MRNDANQPSRETEQRQSERREAFLQAWRAEPERRWEMTHDGWAFRDDEYRQRLADVRRRFDY